MWAAARHTSRVRRESGLEAIIDFTFQVKRRTTNDLDVSGAMSNHTELKNPRKEMAIGTRAFASKAA